MANGNTMNSYELSRRWFDFCFENPEKIKPVHTAIYFFAIEHCNRLGWKDKFGFPSQMVMEAIGIKNWRTYSKALNQIVDFGFIKMLEISKNQYSSNIIAIVKNTKATTKALDKALQKHSTKQGQSTVSIDKQYNNITKNKEQAYDFLKNKNILEMEAFEMQKKKTFPNEENWKLFLTNFNCKVIEEGIPWDYKKLYARLTRLNSNWDKTKKNSKQVKTGLQL